MKFRTRLPDKNEKEEKADKCSWQECFHGAESSAAKLKRGRAKT